MRQLLQSLKTGDLELVDVPRPAPRPGELVLRSRYSLISSGTEKMLLDFGRANPLQKARRHPDRVRQVVDKVRTDGLGATLEAVRSKLDTPIPLGYSNAGRVLDVGDGVRGFAPGDRVVSNGPHAEVVRVPQNLCARIPDGVGDDAASFTVLGSIALQGLRLAEPTLGECFVVIGLGLIGQLTVRLLRAQGCRVLATDLSAERLELAARAGAEVALAGDGDPVRAAMAFSRERGVDGVLIAAATDSDEPVRQAAAMCRKRGRIVLVGVTGLQLSRDDFYKKELSFQVSCSYGPGRYDPLYEEGGQDYPIGFVRWTEQRNFEAVLDLMAAGRLDVEALIDSRVPFSQADEAYGRLAQGSVMGLLLDYGDPRPDEEPGDPRVIELAPAPPATGARCGFIGAGNYASRVLIPAFSAAGADLQSVSTSGSPGGVQAGRKHGFARAVSGGDKVIEDDDVDAVVVATRHDGHARWVVEALRAGKHVFVEKPLCLTLQELASIEQAYRSAIPGRVLTVGFNRRASPHVETMRRLLDSTTEPKAMIVTVNAGALPDDHWAKDRSIGGGRLIGEGCHFVDLMRHLAGAPIIDAELMRMQGADGAPIEDRLSLSLRFADGSVGTLHYLSNGGPRFPKERVELFCQGGVLTLDNFRELRGYDWPGFKRFRTRRQDKGQQAFAGRFLEAIRGEAELPIPIDELFEVARVLLELEGGDVAQ